MRSTYLPGVWTGVASSRGLVMLPPDVPHAVARDMWARLEAGDGMSAVLEALTGAFGTSIAAIPHFAVALKEEEGVRIVVRGPLDVLVTTADGEQLTVSGAGVSTWSERDVPQAVTVEMSAPGVLPDLDVSLPVVSGVVSCGHLLARVTRFGAAPAAPAARTVAPAAETEPDANPFAVPTTIAGGPVSADREPSTAADAEQTTTAPEPVDEQPSLETLMSPPDQTFAELPRDDLDDEAPAAAPDAPDESGRTPVVDEHATDYDSLFGATVIRSVEDAAVRLEDEPLNDHAAAPGATALPASPAEPVAHAEPVIVGPSAPGPAATPTTPATPATPATPTAGGMIAGIPSFLGAAASTPPAAAPAAPAAPPEPTDNGDHDGHTMSLAQLRALQGLPPLEPAAPASAIGVSAPAVPHGTLRVSTGEVVALDRGVIIGRSPRAVRVTGDLPHLVTVPSPSQDISRSHVEVRIEAGTVLVVDLRTTNGTVMRRPGKDPVRLHPGEPEIVMSGDVLDLGDNVTATFEGVE